MIVCTTCGEVLAENSLDFSPDDPGDKVGSSGDYEDQQNPDEVEDGQ
jgi:hypothetical protein